ncbi:hypothetical protein [Spirosoma litoris]
MLLNRFNFLVWSNTPPEASHLSQLPLGGNVGRVSAVVVLIPGEFSTVYINIPSGLLIENPTISLVADNAALTVVSANVGSLTTVTVPGLASPQYYANINPPAGLREEYYRLKIGSDNFPYYSNRVWYRPISQLAAQDTSAVFSFRSARNLANIPYELGDLMNFRQSIRLKCVAANPQNESTIEKYDGVATGKIRTVSIKQNLFHSFTVENADAIAHEGFVAMLSHKDLLVNGNRFSLKTGYQSGTDTAQLATGTFELWETEFGLVTRC